jgi:hypothetical protein
MKNELEKKFGVELVKAPVKNVSQNVSRERDKIKEKGKS